MDEDELPELKHLYQRTAVAKVPRKPTSAFNLYINPNVGSHQLTHKENVKYTNTFHKANKFLMENITMFIKKREGSKWAYSPPKAIESTADLEQGHNHGKLHAQNFVEFDGECMIDEKKVAAFFKETLKAWVKSYPKVKAQAVLTTRMLIAYNRKTVRK